jgi:hypothetical protein
MKTFYALLIMSTLFLTGCSLVPRMTFDTPNTVPQLLNKGKVKEVCKGKAEWDELGNIKSCSKGYYKYNEQYNKEERKMTIVERVKSFFNKILGWGIPGLIIICFIFPGAFTLIGTLIGRALEVAYGASSQILKRVAKAIQKVRKQGADLSTELSKELDVKDKKFISDLKEKENIK